MDYLEYCRGEHNADSLQTLHKQLEKLPTLLKELEIHARMDRHGFVKGLAKNDTPNCDVAFEVSVEDSCLTLLFTSKIYRRVPIEKEGELVALLNELNCGLFGGAFFFSCDDQSVAYRSSLFANGELSSKNILYFVADSVACTADFGSLINDFLRGKISFDECIDLLNGFDDDLSPLDFN